MMISTVTGQFENFSGTVHTDGDDFDDADVHMEIDVTSINTRAGFELKGELNRKEFGLKWDAVTEAGNVVVSDKVTLVIGAQFIKQ